MSTMPNQLQVKDGELSMIDGTDVSSYIKSKRLLEGDVVILRRDDAMRLMQDAERWRAHLDAKFALAS